MELTNQGMGTTSPTPTVRVTGDKMGVGDGGLEEVRHTHAQSLLPEWYYSCCFLYAGIDRLCSSDARPESHGVGAT